MRYELRKKEKELRRQRKLLERELQRESAEMTGGKCFHRVPFFFAHIAAMLIYYQFLPFLFLRYTDVHCALQRVVCRC